MANVANTMANAARLRLLEPTAYCIPGPEWSRSPDKLCRSA